MTSLSYIPQVRKAWPRESTGDLSFAMLSVLGGGLGLWIVYGVVRGDYVIIVANSVGLALVGTLICLKMRDWQNGDPPERRV